MYHAQRRTGPVSIGRIRRRGARFGGFAARAGGLRHGLFQPFSTAIRAWRLAG